MTSAAPAFMNGGTTPMSRRRSDWAGFQEDVRARSGKSQTCAVATLLGRLPEDGRAAVRDALKRPELTTAGIVRALEARLGTKVSYWGFARHRREECNCKK